MTTTTAETLSVDGVVLNTLAKNVESLTGRLRVPQVRGSNPEVPGRHGSIFVRTKTYETGQIVLPMWVRGCDDDGAIPGGSSARREFYKRVDELIALFTRRDGLLDVRHTLPDASVRQALCEVTDVVNLTSETPNPLGMVSVALDVPGVFWRDVSDVSHDTGVGVTVPNTLSLTNFAGATAPMDELSYRFVGPITNPKVEAYRNSIPLGQPIWFQYGAVVPGGQSLIVDCAAWTLSGTGGLTPNMAALTHAGASRWMVVQPGVQLAAPQVRLTGSSTTGATQLVITGRRKFLTG